MHNCPNHKHLCELVQTTDGSNAEDSSFVTVECGGAAITISNVSKAYGRCGNGSPSRVQALHNVSLTIPAGQFLAVCGPNGCGKSTLLSTVAGLLSPDQGHIAIGGTPPASARRAVVFQNFADSLLPWRTAEANITLPLELEHVSLPERARRLSYLLHQLPQDVPLTRYPYQLSGGQQQRICLLRAFITNPHVLIMDEPFSALDLESRSEMQLVLQSLWLQRRTTIVYVSHDIRECVFLADRLIVMSRSPGRIVADLPIELQRPRTHALFEMRSSPVWALEAEATRILNRELRTSS